jgi:hypothetical protein
MRYDKQSLEPIDNVNRLARFNRFYKNYSEKQGLLVEDTYPSLGGQYL